jgi:hypothetical protein
VRKDLMRHGVRPPLVHYAAHVEGALRKARAAEHTAS